MVEPMSEPVDRVLEDELDRLVVGGRIVARRLESYRFETVVAIRADPGNAALAFSSAISRLGRLLGGDPAGAEPTVAGVVGGGLMNLNQAVVEVRIAPVAAGQSRATLTGIAKEGLIKQRTGEKAVRRVLDAREVADIIG
jgi:hypothetical protein